MNDHIIRCAVKDCVYYDNDYCRSTHINVRGKNDGGCCDTFTKNSGSEMKAGQPYTNAATNSITMGPAYGSTGGISCSAAECIHNNQNGGCRKQEIQVSCDCDPCNCCSCSETSCLSFSR